MATYEEELASRIDAASALRRLNHLVVERTPDMALMAEVTATANALADAMERLPERVHPFLSAEHFSMPVVADIDEQPTHLFADSIVSGRANPMGLDAQLWREGDEAVMEVTLGPAFEGAPGRAHGGIVAALIDETMGKVLGIVGTPAFTGRLTITYRAPTPLGVRLTGRARCVEQRGRKLTFTAEVRHGETLIAEGEALFITVDPTSFVVGAAGE